MNRRTMLLGISLSALATLCCGIAAGQEFPLVVETDPLSPAEQQEKFHLPPGFEIELVAAEPQIAKPINLNFDSRGRLYVTSTVEYPFPAAEGKGRDAVKILADRDGDGTYETTAGSIDGLNIPIGVVPCEGDVILFSLPSIYRAKEGDGEARFAQREKLLGPFGFDDTHGLNNGFTRWIDGWVYACHGFRNTSTVAGSDGHQITMNSGNTYRFRPDGSRIEYFTHGQVNPFGLCFDSLGNVFTADCHSKPVYQLLRGGYYPSFGKPHDGLGYAPEMVGHDHGSTGIGGVAYYAADHFPRDEYRNSIFLCNPITHRVNRDKLERHGSTYLGIEQPDFLVCDDPWFRPVDVQLGPDGALYVADFYNCIIGHYEVPLDHPRRDRERGRIWRIVYRGEGEEKLPPPTVPDMSQESLAELWERLGSANLTVRTLATNEIVDRFGAEAAAEFPERIRTSSVAEKRAHGLWVLYRTGGLEGDARDELLAKLAADTFPVVRVHVMKLLAEMDSWDDSEVFETLALRGLEDEDAFVRRAAAEAIGRHPLPGERFSIGAAELLTLWEVTPADDTHLIHAARIALRDNLRVEGAYEKEWGVSDLLAGLAEERRREQAGRLLDVTQGVQNGESALWVVRTLRDELPGRDYPPAYLEYAARFLPAERADELSTLFADSSGRTAERDAALLLAAQRGAGARGAKLPEEIRIRAAQTADRLLDGGEAQQRLGAQLAGELRLTGSFERLATVARSGAAVEGRSAAIDACVAIGPARSIDLLAKLLDEARQPAGIRVKAAQGLGAIDDDRAREKMAAVLPLVPYALAVEIAVQLSRQPKGAPLLVASLEKGQAPLRLLSERQVRITLENTGPPGTREKLAELAKNAPPLDQEVDRLLAARRDEFRGGKHDAGRGPAVYKKHCAGCHKLGEEGFKAAPDLDGIGLRGLERLLEDVLDPSRNVDPAFYTTTLQTTDGRVLTGLVLVGEDGAVTLIDAEGKQHRLAAGEIEERRQSPLSAMPSNFATTIPPAELNDLLSYLLDQRQAPEP